VSDRLLVSPVVVGRGETPQRVREWLVPALLQLAASGSRWLFRGRGVGFACTVAARLMAAGGRVSFQLGDGGTFSVRTDDRYWLTYLLLEQSYELDLDHFLGRALTSRDAFLDCGANLGLWSIAAARVIGNKERVVAVEAGASTFAQLATNWEANGRSFTVLHRAVGDVSGKQVSFFASAGDHASATLVEGLSPGDAKPETTTTVSLLDLIHEQNTGIANDALIFVKLDIEGMERQVFATIDPDRHGNLVVLYEDHGSETDHVTAFVLERGFRTAFMADDGSLEPIKNDTLHRLDELKVNPARGYNLLAVAPGGVAASRLTKLFDIDLA
jgi:FkbM family methyltransferase